MALRTTDKKTERSAAESQVPFPSAIPSITVSGLKAAGSKLKWDKYAKTKGSGNGALVDMWKKAGGSVERLREFIAEPGGATVTREKLESIWRRFANAQLGAIMDVVNADYFVILNNASQAHDVLQDKADGTFFIRFSSEVGSYALSVRHRSKTAHWRVTRTNDGSLSIDSHHYRNLQELVDTHHDRPLHHSDDRNGVCLKLALPSVDARQCNSCSRYVRPDFFDKHHKACSSGQAAAQTDYGNVRDVWSAQATGSPSAKRNTQRGTVMDDSPYSAVAHATVSAAPAAPKNTMYASPSAVAAAPSGASRTFTALVYLGTAKPQKMRVSARTMDEFKMNVLRQTNLGNTNLSLCEFMYEDPDFKADVAFPKSLDEFSTDMLKVKVHMRATAQRSQSAQAVLAAAEKAGGGLLDSSKLEFGEELGKGAFGVVLAGKYDGFDVAIKTSHSEEGREDFEKEIEILIRLPRCEQLVSYFGYANIRDPSSGQEYLYVVLEKVMGGSLDKYVSERQLSNRNLLQIMLDIAVGMDTLHAHGIIHRDLAMRNILVTEDGRAKVTDFGLSREVDGNGEYEMISETKLPLKHMSPEALATGKFSTKNDVWAFGVVVWTMFSGHDPYAFLGRTQVAIAVRDQQLELSALPPTTPVVARNIVKQCQNFDPKDRPDFQTVTRLLRAEDFGE